MLKINIVQFQNIPNTPPMEGFLFCIPLPHPPGNSSLASYFASKILALKTPHPPGIFNDLPWAEYGYFLELHIKYNHILYREKLTFPLVSILNCTILSLDLALSEPTK